MKKFTRKNVLFVAIALLLLVATIVIALVALPNKKLEEVSVQAVDNVRPEDFSIENSLILFKYNDGSVDTLKVTQDMLATEDLAKLTQPGKHKVTINYQSKKSVETEIHLLRNVKGRNNVLDKIVQGVQIAAPQNNINGELVASFYYQLPDMPMKEYHLSLKFTLDIDQEEGAENYLELAIFEENKQILGIYYKDNGSLEERPYFYLKVDGPFVGMLEKTETKLPSVSTDEFFGDASVPSEDSLVGFEQVLSKIIETVSDESTKGIVDTLLGFLLKNAAVADDASSTVISIDFQNLLTWLPLVSFFGGFDALANDFLTSVGADFTVTDALMKMQAKKILLQTSYNEDGALSRLRLIDNLGNEKIQDVLRLKIDGKVDAGINIKLSVSVDSTSYSLPSGIGLENWEESDVSFERWILLQYRKMMGGQPDLPWMDEIEKYTNIDYKKGVTDNVYNKLDVYRPAALNGEKLPVLISIHGGGWVHGNKEYNRTYCQYHALQGFAVVNINYHLLPAAQMPVPMQDVFAVFNFVMENAETYGFDTDNVFMTGDSAGGHYCMLALSILGDPTLQEIYGVETELTIKAASVSSTGFTFTEVLKLPIPFAHFYVNQFFSEDLPYTAYKDDPRYIEMAKSLNLENNKIENFPPMYISTAHGDLFKVHSDRLAAQLELHDIEHIYDNREQGDPDNPDNFFLGHNFNVAAPGWKISQVVNKAMTDFFKSKMT